MASLYLGPRRKDHFARGSTLTFRCWNDSLTQVSAILYFVRERCMFRASLQTVCRPHLLIGRDFIQNFELKNRGVIKEEFENGGKKGLIVGNVWKK
jgi:hypothetical protein